MFRFKYMDLDIQYILTLDKIPLTQDSYRFIGILVGSFTRCFSLLLLITRTAARPGTLTVKSGTIAPESSAHPDAGPILKMAARPLHYDGCVVLVRPSI